MDNYREFYLYHFDFAIDFGWEYLGKSDTKLEYISGSLDDFKPFLEKNVCKNEIRVLAIVPDSQNLISILQELGGQDFHDNVLILGILIKFENGGHTCFLTRIQLFDEKTKTETYYEKVGAYFPERWCDFIDNQFVDY
jgi:hypothetical protein